MKERQIGPFSRTPRLAKALDGVDWSAFYQDSNNDYDEWQEHDEESWGRYIDDTENVGRVFDPRSSEEPKRISGPVLFPNCDLITNNAVRMVRPVPFIRCRSLTTELVYG
jgi:hypothetical protein